MHALFLVHVIYVYCCSLVQSYVLQRPSFMGLAEPDERVLFGSERCLQLVVRARPPAAAASASSAVATTSATVTADLGFVVGLYYT